MDWLSGSRVVLLSFSMNWLQVTGREKRKKLEIARQFFFSSKKVKCLALIPMNWLQVLRSRGRHDVNGLESLLLGDFGEEM